MSTSRYRSPAVALAIGRVGRCAARNVEPMDVQPWEIHVFIKMKAMGDPGDQALAQPCDQDACTNP